MLTGNNILIVESASQFCKKLEQSISETGAQTSVAADVAEAKKLLKVYDYDVVICAYYLKDGVIFNVIDWCKGNLERLPVFITIGSELTGDLNSMQRNLISRAYKRNEIPEMIKDIRKLLFNFESFLKGLVEAVEQRGISLELIVNNEKYTALPVEIDEEGMLIEVQGEVVPADTFGYLRIVICEGSKIDQYSLAGVLGESTSSGQYFRINENYDVMMKKLTKRINDEQTQITSFLKKAAGL